LHEKSRHSRDCADFARERLAERRRAARREFRLAQ
jgi:hypothetical protein